MRHKRNLVFTSLFVSFIAALVFIAIPNVNTSPGIINVPGDYSTIQAAINAAIPGDTIFVWGGTYNENVTVTKGLTLTAKSNAKIVGGVWIKDIHTFTNPITVENFIIENGTSITATKDYGIKISGDIGLADQAIVDMHILNNTLINCGKTDDVTDETWFNAAFFFDANHFGSLGDRYDTIFTGTGEISHNTIINNLGDPAKRTQLGIGVRSGRNMKINYNNISGNVAEGIHHWGPVNTTSIGNYEISHNYIDLTGWIGNPIGNNPRGIWSYAPQSSISHNTVISKWIGIVLTYWDDTYWGGGTAGNLALTVSHNVIHPPASGNMSVGLRISGNNSQITDNEIYGATNNVTGYGVGLLFEGWGHPEWGERTECSNNTFTGNYIHDNYDGIWTFEPPYNNTFNNEFHYNNIENNTNSGMTNNNNGTIVNATHNWWGNASGPTHALNPSGTGDAVSDNVTYTPWLTEEYALMVNITYPTEGAYLDSIALIWINGTITETDWMGQYPQINDTSFALDLTSWNGTNFAFYNVTAIGDCTHSYRVNFTDLADNTASDTVTFTLDTVYPVVDITHPTEDYYFDSEVAIWINGTFTEKNFDVSGLAINGTFTYVTHTWNSTTYEGTFSFKNSSALADSTYHIMVSLTDKAGKTGNVTVTFTVDTVPPVVNITYPTDGAYLDSVAVIWINGTITEPNMGALEPAINDTNFHLVYWNSATGVFAFQNNSAIPDCTHYYKVNFTDLAGKTGYDTVYFTIDTTKPLVEITTPTDGHYFDSESVIWINGTFTEKNLNLTEPLVINHTGFILANWTWDSITYEGTFAFCNNTVILDGDHTVMVSLTDLAGKTGFDTVHFHIDTTYPVVDITFPTDDYYFDSESVIWINGTFTEKNFNTTRLLDINHTGFTLADWTWNSATYEGTFAFWNTTALIDGTYHIKISITDLAGKTGYDAVYFTVDTVPPVVDIAHPTNGQYLNTSTIWINGTVTELNIGSLEPHINDTAFSLVSWNPLTGTFAFKNNTVIQDGTISLTVNFTDLAGKTGSNTVYFILDTTLPIVNITYPTEGAYLNVPTIWVNGTVTELNMDTLEPSINDTRFTLAYWNSTTGEFAFNNNTIISDGLISLVVSFTDLAGNTGSDSVTFTLDTTAPVVEITYPSDSEYVSAATLWVNGTVTEANKGTLEPSINDTRFELAFWDAVTGIFSFKNNTTITDGPISVSVNFTNMAGSTGIDTVSFTLDTTAPIVTITSPLGGSYISVSSYLWINGTVTELNMGGLEPAINDTRFDLTHWDSATGIFAFKNNTAIPDGPVSVEVSFTDLAGNTGEDTLSFTLDTTAPTEPTDFAVTVVEGNSTFTWMASTDNLVLKGYCLELNGEIHYVGNVTSYTWPGLSAGGYTAWLWATDMAENNSTKTTLTFIISQKADIIDVKCPADVYKDQWFLLNATVENVGNITGIIFVNVSDATGVLASDTVTLASGNTSIITFNLTAPTSLGSTTLNVTAGHDIIIDDYWAVTMEVLNRPPVALFTYSPEFPIANETVAFNASTSYDLDGTIDVYKWDFGDGTAIETSPTPTITHIYGRRGNYTVTLTVIDDDNSENKTDATITIIDYPTADFTYSPTYPIAGETVTFNASTSTPNGGTIVSYFWNFGDGTTVNVTSAIITHTYLSFGNYTVTLTVKDSEGLTNSCSKVITIIDYPTADFTYSLIYPIAGETVTFDASTSTANGGTIVSYFWDFGDGTNATGLVTSHIYSSFGTYTLTLKIVDSEELTNSTSKPINVRQYPTANFTYSPPLPMVGETVTFNASSSEPNGGTIATYTWDFGDTQTGTDIVINHTYSTYGTHNVTLTVTDTEGLSNTFTQTIRIIIEPTADFMYAPTYPVVNQSVLFDASTSYDPDGIIISYTWNFGDGNITTVEDQSIHHVFKNATLYDVTLTVTDNDGLTHTITKRITVYTTVVSVHDVAMISIEPESSWVYQGRTLNITVTVTNEGTDIETFNVSLYYDNTKIETYTDINLFPGKNLTLTFTWNTTNLYPAQYNISAVASIVPEETDTTDNTLGYGTISVLWLGDINHDGKIDMRDIANIARGFGSHKGEPRYDPKCDLNSDGKIDMRDIAPAAKNFGKP